MRYLINVSPLSEDVYERNWLTVEILDQRTVAVEFPTEKLFRQKLEKGNQDFNLVIAKPIQVKVNFNLKITNQCSC